MRKNRAKKGSIPVVCYNTSTKSYLGLDAEHPLMDEDWIKVIGSRADFGMDGLPLDKSKVAEPKPEPKAVVVDEVDLGGAEVIDDDDDEYGQDPEMIDTPDSDDAPELGYEELKEALIKRGVDFKGNAKKVDLAILLDEATHKE